MSLDTKANSDCSVGYRLTFRVTHPLFKMIEISDGLGLNPDYGWNVGERRINRRGEAVDSVKRDTYCGYDIGRGADISGLDLDLFRFLEKMDRHKHFLRKLVETGGALVIYFAWFISTEELKHRFTSKLFIHLNELGIYLMIELYPDPQPVSQDVSTLEMGAASSNKLDDDDTVTEGYWLYFKVRHPFLKLEQISIGLGYSPVFGWNVGERAQNRKNNKADILRDYTYCVYCIDYENAILGFIEEISLFLDEISNKVDFLREIVVTGGNIAIYLEWVIENRMTGVILSGDLLRKFAMLKMDILFDIKALLKSEWVKRHGG